MMLIMTPIAHHYKIWNIKLYHKRKKTWKKVTLSYGYLNVVLNISLRKDIVKPTYFVEDTQPGIEPL